MIKALIFDCFGVLTTDLWRAFIDNLPENVDVARAHELNRQYGSGLISREEFLDQVYEATGSKPEEVESQQTGQVNKNTKLLSYIAELKPEYKIGLLSNIASNWITDQFLTKDEQQLFDSMIFSHDVGMTKPDPDIFRQACQRLGVEPAEAVMIDDIDRYCAAAESIGMKAVVYEDFSGFKQQLEQLINQRT